jgi:hypothetical protein
METIKRVWLLGAGFNRPLNGPLLKDLLAGPEAVPVKEMLPTGANPGLEVEGTLIRQFFQQGLRTVSWAHAEVFLDLIETARIDEESGVRSSSAMSRLQLSRMAGINSYASASDAARRAVIIDCWNFLNSNEVENKDSERWLPFRHWAEGLTHNDTVITFNYDAAPELLIKHAGEKMRIIQPHKVDDDLKLAFNFKQAPVLKMHGSVNWGVDRRNNILIDPANTAVAVMDQDKKPIIGFPGPTKQSTCGGLLSGIWAAARDRILDANDIVIIGYSFPATDNYARTQLLDWLGSNSKKAAISVVLGPDSVDAVRVQTLLKRYAGAATLQFPKLSGQEYLTVFRGWNRMSPFLALD